MDLRPSSLARPLTSDRIFPPPSPASLPLNPAPVSDPRSPPSLQFDEQLQGLKNKSSLMRVLTSNRLRKDLELLNAVVFARFKVYAVAHQPPG